MNVKLVQKKIDKVSGCTDLNVGVATYWEREDAGEWGLKRKIMASFLNTFKLRFRSHINLSSEFRKKLRDKDRY